MFVVVSTVSALIISLGTCVYCCGCCCCCKRKLKLDKKQKFIFNIVLKSLLVVYICIVFALMVSSFVYVFFIFM